MRVMELHVFCFDYCVLEIERTASAGDFSLAAFQQEEQ